MAFLKPQMAALFGLYLLICHRDWIACLVAASVVVGLTLLVSWQVSTSPWEMISSMTATAVNDTEVMMMSVNLGLLDPLKLWVLPKEVLQLDMVIGVAATTFLLIHYRRLSPITLLAIPATFTVLWTYNQQYDSTVLGLPIVAAARLFFVGRRAGLHVFMIRYGLVGMVAIVTGLMAMQSAGRSGMVAIVTGEFVVGVQFASRLFYLCLLFWMLWWEKRFQPQLEMLPEATPSAPPKMAQV
jgi:hypothetical protein